jgi:hypothetical protein
MHKIHCWYRRLVIMNTMWYLTGFYARDNEGGNGFIFYKVHLCGLSLAYSNCQGYHQAQIDQSHGKI